MKTQKGKSRCNCSSSSIAYQFARSLTSALGPVVADSKDSTHRGVCLTSGMLGHWTTPETRVQSTFQFSLCGEDACQRAMQLVLIMLTSALLGTSSLWMSEENPVLHRFLMVTVELGVESTCKARPLKATITHGTDKSLWTGNVKVPVLTLGKEWALLVRLLIQLHMANLL